MIGKKKVKHLLRWKKFNPVLIYPRFFDLNLILILQKYSQGGLLKTQKDTYERIYFKDLLYQGWNRPPAQVGCMRQVLRAGALGRGMGWGGRREEG